MTRYFMTIPEAVSLVVQAGAIGGRGQVFVLDMGEPVRILELAESMIRLSGREPGRDVAIDVIGARPGEKLHEELWTAEEQVAPSAHPAILRVTRPEIDAAWLEGELAELARLVDMGATLDLVGRLAAMVREPRRNGTAVPVAETAGAASATETA
jgi:FlaA1/EpsC-like NDP-sugar epimerase